MKTYRPAREYKPEQKKCWFVVANRTEAVIFKETQKKDLSFVYRFSNPKGKRREAELDSDRPGKTASSASRTLRHALDTHNNKHEVQAQKFSKTISKALTKAAKEKKFDELVLVAEPHFLGLLRNEIPKELKPYIKHEIHHEYNGDSEPELKKHIFQALENQTE